MKFRTEMPIEKADFGITYASRLFFIGSCFSTNMAERLEERLLKVTCNPFGVMFNAASIAQALERIQAEKLLTQGDATRTPDGLWNSYHLHGMFASSSAGELIEEANKAIREAHKALEEADTLFITLGTAWVYELATWPGKGLIVANCHKCPPTNFRRRKMTAEEVCDTLEPVLRKLQEKNKALNIVFTVSPIRHLKDGLHQNALSKATLLLATDMLCQRLGSRASYFASYEMLNDDLRDYRFYADDLVHPSAAAIDYIYEMLEKTYFGTQMQKDVEEVEKVVRASEHRPLNPASAEHQAFCKKQMEAIKRLESRLKGVDFEAVKERLRRQMKEE